MSRNSLELKIGAFFGKGYEKTFGYMQVTEPSGKKTSYVTNMPDIRPAEPQRQQLRRLIPVGEINTQDIDALDKLNIATETVIAHRLPFQQYFDSVINLYKNSLTEDHYNGSQQRHVEGMRILGRIGEWIEK